MVQINILDVGKERYELSPSNNIFGRRWDDRSEEVVVNFPAYELSNGTTCTMIVTRGGNPIDNIIVQHNVPFKVTSNLSQYESVEVGFSFQKEDYIKNSAIDRFRFLNAQKPNDFVPIPPEDKDMFFELQAKAFTGVSYDENAGEYIFYNESGSEVARVVGSSGATALGELEDVELLALLNGQILEFKDGKWINSSRLNVLEQRVDDAKVSYVFDTEQQLENWLSGTYIRPDGVTPEDLAIGNNIYILDATQEDYWVSELPVTSISNLSPLENEKIDLSDYYTKSQADAKFINKYQGEGNVGKTFKVGADGDVELDFPTAGGKKYASIVVGTVLSGHTANDVDYLCDGVNDEVEIQQAIDDASSSGGGNIVFLDGEYLCGYFELKSNVSLRGNHNVTIRPEPSSSIVNIIGDVHNVTIDGFRWLMTIYVSSNTDSEFKRHINITNNFIDIDNFMFLKLISYDKNFLNMTISNNITSGGNVYLFYNESVQTANLKNCLIENNAVFRANTGSRPDAPYILFYTTISNNIFNGYGQFYIHRSSMSSIIANNVAKLDFYIPEGVPSSVVIANNSESTISENLSPNVTIIDNNIANRFQVTKTPTLPNDVIRLQDMQELIDTIVGEEESGE